jgi:excinuclease ABC subunit B
VVQYMTKEQLQKSMNNTRRQMEKAAKALDFIEAAKLRDEMFALEKLFREKFL